MDLIIDKEFENILPQLPSEEYTGLEKDIIKHGILNPIIIWEKTIVDGHNRYAIAQAHRFPDSAIPTKEVSFESKSQAIEWIINNQKNRRNMTKSELVFAWQTWEAEKAKEAKERMLSGKKNPSSNLNEGRPNRTAAEVAKKIGVSENTYRDMKLITEKGTEEQIERMNKGGMGNGVSAIAKEIKGTKVKETFRCRECGKLFSISEAHRGHQGKPENLCRECHNKINRLFSEKKRLEGTEGFYVESVEEKQWSPDDIANQLKRDFDSYIEGLKIELDVHKKEIESHEKIIDEAIDVFIETLKMMKGVYR